MCVTCSIVASLSAWRRTAWKTPRPQLSYCCVTSPLAETLSLRHCPGTGVSAEPFPSNGRPCWLHNSGFQQTCYNMIRYAARYLTMFKCAATWKKSRAAYANRQDIKQILKGSDDGVQKPSNPEDTKRFWRVRDEKLQECVH
jgi:hypothetical protein